MVKKYKVLVENLSGLYGKTYIKDTIVKATYFTVNHAEELLRLGFLEKISESNSSSIRSNTKKTPK